MSQHPSVTPDGTPLDDPGSVGSTDRPLIGSHEDPLPPSAPQSDDETGAGADSGVAAGEGQP